MEDEWVSCGVKLMDSFPRLYSLEVDKSCCLRIHLSKSNESVMFVGLWRRNLFTWEENVTDNLSLVILKVKFLPHGQDT